MALKISEGTLLNSFQANVPFLSPLHPEVIKKPLNFLLAAGIKSKYWPGMRETSRICDCKEFIF